MTGMFVSASVGLVVFLVGLYFKFHDPSESSRKDTKKKKTSGPASIRP